MKCLTQETLILYLATIIKVSKRHSISMLTHPLASIIIINKDGNKFYGLLHDSHHASMDHLFRKSCSSTSIILFFCQLVLSTMKTMTATKAIINIRIPPRAEGMAMAVNGTISGAGIDGETIT